MRTLILVASTLLMSCNAAVGANSTTGSETVAPDLPAGAAVLGESAQTTILQQCSRTAPQPGEAGWRPGAADIAALEGATTEALRARHNASDPDWSRFPDGRRRQYVGIVRGGRRYVYGNAYPRDVDRYAADPHRWQQEPVTVCDGGPAFFGVEYDVEARRITHLAFNGMA